MIPVIIRINDILSLTAESAPAVLPAYAQNYLSQQTTKTMPGNTMHGFAYPRNLLDS